MFYSRPIEFTITPDKSLGFGPNCATGYTVTGRYYKTPSELSATTDTPALPTLSHAHRHRAMMLYGAFEAAQDLYAMGEQGFTQMMKILSNNQLPRWFRRRRWHEVPAVKQDYYPMKGGLDLLTPAIQLFPGKCFDAQNRA